MSVPKDRKFTKDHEWLLPAGGNRFKVGITDYAQRELGDVVYVDLPSVGATTAEGKGFASVESVKAVSDIYSPITGKVVEANATLSANPELINSDPYDGGWIAVIEGDAGQGGGLLDAAAYEALLAEISK